MLRFLCVGQWTEPMVATEWVASGRRILPQVESAIDSAWTAAAARLGSKLFDGPMCRLESWHADQPRLQLELSRTSYKPFVGTNMANRQLARQFGSDVMANPLGVSPVLLTADNCLLLGRRNVSVAYYPGWIHPFAGCVEPADSAGSASPNVFNTVRRELDEELHLTPAAIAEISCLGLVQDLKLLQCELIFFVRLTLHRQKVEKQLDEQEHRSILAVAATREAVEPIVHSRGIITGEPALTPVAVASLALWGRRTLGESWFAAAAARLLPRQADNSSDPT